jgi:hypothetical protein
MKTLGLLWLAHEPARQGEASRFARVRRSIRCREDRPSLGNIPEERKPQENKALNGKERNFTFRSLTSVFNHQVKYQSLSRCIQPSG